MYGFVSDGENITILSVFISLISINVSISAAENCSIISPVSISAFNRSEVYRFSRTCEHVLVRPCVDMSDFAVTVDFVSDDLSDGRIGLRYKGSRFIYAGGSVIAYNAALTGSTGNTEVYDVGGSAVTVTSNGGDVTISAEDIGVTVQASSSTFTISVASTGSSSVCGLCGSSTGQLVYGDGVRVADITNVTQVMQFIDSHAVAARDQFLREQSKECGEYINVLVQ